jgi:hypothetical protein
MASPIGYVHVALLPLLKEKKGGDFQITQCPQLVMPL